MASWTATPDEFRWTRDARANAARFRNGNPPGALWPEVLIRESEPHFERANFTRLALLDPARPIERRLVELHAVLSRTALKSPVHWVLQSDAGLQAAAMRLAERGDHSPEVERELAVRALSHRKFLEAASHFERAALPDAASRDALLRAYALAMAGRDEAAIRTAEAAGLERSPEYARAWTSVVELMETAR